MVSSKFRSARYHIKTVSVIFSSTLLLSLAAIEVYAGADKDLLEAAEKNDIGVVRTALNKGADVNAEDNFEHTALWLAQVMGHRDIIRILKKAGAR